MNQESFKWELVKNSKREWIDNHSDKEEEVGPEAEIIVLIEAVEEQKAYLKSIQIPSLNDL